MNQALTRWVASRVTAPSDVLSDGFLARARQAAKQAHWRRRLGAAAEGQAFQPLTLPDFLARAARTARVNLARLLPTAEQGQPWLVPWIQLAKSIGLRRDHLILLVRLWMAEQHMHPADSATPLLARGDEAPAASRPRERTFGSDEQTATHLLAFLEKSYADSTRSTLAACLEEIDR